MKDILKLIKSIFKDTKNLYRNFLHWNISKVFISLGSIVLSFLLALPSIIALVIMYFVFDLNSYITSLDVSILSLLGFLSSQPLVFILFIIFSLLTFFSALIGYSYRRVLFTKLNLSYIDGKNLNYIKNSYFDFKLIWKYFKVISLVALFVSVPFFVFIIGFFILFFIFGGASGVQALLTSSQFNLFSLIALLLLVICIVAFVYISYRLYFAVIMLVDEKHYKDNETPMFYIKKSFLKTKDIFVFMKFILIMILLSIVILPFGFLQDFYSKSLKDVRVYRQYYSMGETEKSIVDKDVNNTYINELKMYYYGFSAEKLNSLEVTYFYLNYFLIILNYIIFFGLFEMVIVSFYKHEIIKKKSILSDLF
ncbi:MAG: hypothetical protein WC850_05060 [Candidatus Gracilibacteria bacterium]